MSGLGAWVAVVLFGGVILLISSLMRVQGEGGWTDFKEGEWKMFALAVFVLAVFLALAIYFDWDPGPDQPWMDPYP